MEKKNGIPAGMIVVATVVGGILGTAAGLLLAPQSGKVTREKIRETYESAASSIEGMTSELDRKVSGIAEKVASEVKGLPDQVMSEAGRLAKDAEQTLTKTMEMGSAYVTELTGSVTATLQEGKKKLIEKKDIFLAGR